MPLCKRRIIAFLFSIYFLLFVLSPVCFTVDGQAGNNAIFHQTNLNTKNIRVVWELILSKYSANNDDEGSRTNVQLLIRKARALVSSNSIVKLTPSESAEFDYSDNTFSQNFHVSLDQRTKPECRTGSYLSVSGLSPPTFS
jgi:hypothetical protein